MNIKSAHNYLLTYVKSPSQTEFEIKKIKDVNNLIIYKINFIINDFPFMCIATNNLENKFNKKWICRLFLYVPNKIDYDSCFTKIGSGNLTDKCKSNKLLLDICHNYNMICMEIFDIPNQPLNFDDNKYLVEDELMAYCWKTYIETLDINYIINFHMVKTVNEILNFCDSFVKEKYSIELKGHIVHGSSKRGLTAWLTSTVSDRVLAIIPAVYDTLNMKVTLKNQKIKLGNFCNKLEPYVCYNLFDELLDHYLFDIIDPLSYDSYIKIPKFIINSSNDNFFTPDSSNYYFDQISNPKYLRYIPNINHYLESDIFDNHIKKIINLILNNYNFEYTIINNSNKIKIDTKEKITDLNLWYAENDVFDFGMKTYIKYNIYSLKHLINNEIDVTQILIKQNKYLVYFIEIRFETEFVVTSNVFVF